MHGQTNAAESMVQPEHAVSAMRLFGTAGGNRNRRCQEQRAMPTDGKVQLPDSFQSPAILAPVKPECYEWLWWETG